MLKKADRENILNAKYAYVEGPKKIMHCVDRISSLHEGKYAFVDISGYGVKELYGFPVYKEKISLTLFKDEHGNLSCAEGIKYLESCPVLCEIYMLAENAAREMSGKKK